MDRPQLLLAAAQRLSKVLGTLQFAAPVSHVYNPLEYAFRPFEAYVRKYAATPKQVLFFGMNPGPFGMTQSGVPFGEIAHVRDWLGIEAEVGRPEREHPRRKVMGFACPRSEVSGRRLWGLWKSIYGEPERFFSWAFIANYCPLAFMAESGRNLTPDKLEKGARASLYAACDEHIREVVRVLEPAWVVGIGSFAKGRAESALRGLAQIASIPHPSPASPAANRAWDELALRALAEQGVPRP